MMNEPRNTLSQYLSDLSLFILFSGLVFFALSSQSQSYPSSQFLETYFADYSSLPVKNHSFAIAKTTKKLPTNNSKTFVNSQFEKYFNPLSIQVSTQNLLPESQSPFESFLNCSFDYLNRFFSLKVFFLKIQPFDYQCLITQPREGWQIFAYLSAIPRLV